MNDQSSRKRIIETHISEILEALGSSEDVESMSMKMANIADRYDLFESNNRLGEAAGIVYISGILNNNPVTLAMIAEKAGTSTETVRKYKTQLASELKTKREWPGLPSE
jgi:transcription initiation factor TFIIIB Brf1 subunit/transcription initiation factor TFIIB